MLIPVELLIIIIIIIIILPTFFFPSPFPPTHSLTHTSSLSLSFSPPYPLPIYQFTHSTYHTPLPIPHTLSSSHILTYYLTYQINLFIVRFHLGKRLFSFSLFFSLVSLPPLTLCTALNLRSSFFLQCICTLYFLFLGSTPIFLFSLCLFFYNLLG